MKVSIILPVKDQSDKLIRNLEKEIIPFFDKAPIVYDVLIVSDASSDEEQEKLEKAMKKMPLQVKLLPYEATKGKGWAIKKGILASNSDWILFMDADLATDLKTFYAFQPFWKDYDCVIASRNAEGSIETKKKPFIRRLMSWGSRIIIKMLFHLGVGDTQCGFKMYKTDIAKKMVEKQIIAGPAYDVEYLYYLKLNGYKYKEVGCVWTDDEDSSFKRPVKTAFKFFKDLLKIKHNRKRYLPKKGK